MSTDPKPFCTVISDASYCPVTKAGGWAYWLAAENQRIKRFGEFKNQAKHSAEAEMWGILNALFSAHTNGYAQILVQCDCQGALHSLRKKWMSYKHWRTFELKKSVDRQCKEKGTKIMGVCLWDVEVITFKHVRGHTSVADKRSFVNRWCDEHARVGMLLGRQRAKKNFNFNAESYCKEL